MTASELKRKLEKLGCTVTNGTNHWIVTYRGAQTTIPRHPSREIRKGTENAIYRQLGLKGK